MACMKNGFVEGLLLDGRYESMSPLNHGSFGMVFLAKDTVNGDHVAIKCLSKASANKDRSTVDVDENSVELLCHDRLGSHPNIVNLLHSFETPAHIYLVLEYCAMGDLYEAIRLGRGPLQTENVRDFMLQLVGAVEHMHAKGLYHRDIKPENIFLMANGSMKLGDLGLATGDAWSTEACVGSDRYMSPEQYDPQEGGYSSAKADIWAIGVCLLNVLFARNPFVTPTETDKLFSDFARDNKALFDIFPNMSQDTFEILNHAMALDPSKRSMEAVRNALERAVTFTTDEEVLDDFCTETRRGTAPASANRAPLRTPSITSPQVDQGGAFPWAKALQMSPERRQLSVIQDNESYSEDLFSDIGKDRSSWYSLAQNSSLTSGLDSTFGTSVKSMVLQQPASRYPQQSKPVAIPSSLPARVASLSSIFKKDTYSKSWSEIWDEDEEDGFIEYEQALQKRRENNGRTWSQESGDQERTLHSSVTPDARQDTTGEQTPRPKPAQLATQDDHSEQDVFVFEDVTPRYSPPAHRPAPPPKQPSKFDKWAALGNRRRQFQIPSQSTESLPQTSSRKRDNQTNNWRAAFGLKVFAGAGNWAGAWDRSSKKESAAAKVLDWRRHTQVQQWKTMDGAGDEVEWVGGP